MTVTTPVIENLTLCIVEDIHVRASIDKTFAALLDQLGPYNETPEGVHMNMKLEPWPGGRWYRDLANGNGHFWAQVQAFKKPTLLEFSGPLFMSYPVSNNVQYRLSEVEGGTLIKFRHSAFGLISDDHRAGVNNGWGYINAAAKKRAEGQLAGKSAVQ